MALSSELISQFAKVATSEKTEKGETTVYGTVVEYNGSKYVKLDGSDLLTPVSSTTNYEADDRVSVMIKNHTATVTGNVTSPAPRTEDLNRVDDKVDNIGTQITEFDIIIAGKVETEEFVAQVARIDELKADTLRVTEQLTAAEADITDLKADNVTINDTLLAREADIERLEARDAEITGNLDAANADIDSLQAGNVIVRNELDAHKASIDALEANSATIDELNAANARIDNLDASYATIDFANIGEAAFKKLYSEFGIIKNLVVEDGTFITGELVGVTIKGDIIEGNTIIAEKLVVRGTDGLLYKLNMDALGASAENIPTDTLHGSVITARSITADRVSVTDLVAFGATIGGFTITESSIYSNGKGGPDSENPGVYMDSSGQFGVGNSTNYLKFYEDEDGTFKLEITADVIKMGGSRKTVKEEIEEAVGRADDAQNTANSAATNIANAQLIIDSIQATISALVTGPDGSSLMTQTENGWTFSTSLIESAIADIQSSLSDLSVELGDADKAIVELNTQSEKWNETSEHVQIGTYNDQPCIYLSESDTVFRLAITNTSIMFLEGENLLTYITNAGLHTDNIVVDHELRQGNFIWAVRSNGNYGLRWKEGNV